MTSESHSDDISQDLVGHHSSDWGIIRRVSRLSAGCVLHESPRVQLCAFKGSASWSAARWRKRSERRSPSAWPDLVGVTAATTVVMNWTHLRGRLIKAQRREAEADA